MPSRGLRDWERMTLGWSFNRLKKKEENVPDSSGAARG